MTSLLYMFRHGTAAPRGFMVGQADLPLLPQGEAEIRRWAESLSDRVFHAAWSSPLLRARQTADILLKNNSASTHEARIVDGLREISLGEWEGKTKHEVMRKYPEIWEARGRDMVHTAPAGGESFQELASRVLPAFTAVCAQAARKGRSLLVGHQAVNRVILAHLAGMPLESLRDIPQPNGALSILEVDASGGARLLGQYSPPA